MTNKIRITVYCATTVLFAGCAAGPQIPSELQYFPPRANSSVATIRGSGERRHYIIDYHAFIAEIDGKVVMAGKEGWDSPIPIKLGHHRLFVELNRGNWVASTHFDLDTVAGASYQLRYTTNSKFFAQEGNYIDFWITDMATSKAVTPIKRALLVPPENVGRSPLIVMPPIMP